MRRYLLTFILLAGNGIAADCCDDNRPRTLPIVIAANAFPPYILPFALPEHLDASTIAPPESATTPDVAAAADVAPSPTIQISAGATAETPSADATVATVAITETPKVETPATEKLQRTKGQASMPLTTTPAEKAAAARNFFTAAHYYFAGQKFLAAVKLRWRDFAAAAPNDGASASVQPTGNATNDNAAAPRAAAPLNAAATASVEPEVGATAGVNTESEISGVTANIEPEVGATAGVNTELKIGATASERVESEISGATATVSNRQTAGAPLVHEAITIAMPEIRVGEASGTDRAAAPPNESAGESVDASVSENAEASVAAAALPHKDNVAENVAEVAGEIKAENFAADAGATAKIAATAASPNASLGEKFSTGSPNAASGEKSSTGDLAANERDLAAIQRRGVLVVGMLRDNPPPFADGDEPGCDADWAAALARALKVELQINRDFDSTANLLTAVAAGGIDAAISGLKIGSPTVAGVEIASPYLGNWTVLLLNFAALETIPNGEFLTPEALNRPEVIVAVEADSPYEKIARELFPRATLRREVYADGASPFLSVFGKDAHATLRDSFSLLRDRREHPQRWEQRGAEVTAVKLRRHRELYGVALAKTAPRLRALLDRLDAEINDLPLPFQQLTIHN
ncbi:MAG: transporter substrate-binding domain-containing protein [Planctomycetota bacterium]|jgi:ABC-type amino acid transport substrate-binding protein|nr:transporter substrate-binding domain-containing protein [Planctomycetota bacterium]